MLTWIKGRLWKAIFWWKKRTGWIDFKEKITVTGRVMSTHMASDGDVTFNVWPDDEFLWTITWYGGRLGRKLHCEVPPWIQGDVRKLAQTLKEGDRVRVGGDWGYDGVHFLDANHPPWWKFILLELPSAIFRHQPNVHDGWFEIHPVEKLEKL